MGQSSAVCFCKQITKRLQMVWQQLPHKHLTVRKSLQQHLAADMEPQQWCTISSCGCLEALMAASVKSTQAKANQARYPIACLPCQAKYPEQVNDDCSMLMPFGIVDNADTTL